MAGAQRLAPTQLCLDPLCPISGLCTPWSALPAFPLLPSAGPQDHTVSEWRPQELSGPPIWDRTRWWCEVSTCQVQPCSPGSLLPLSFSPNMVRNTVKLIGPGASLIISSISSFFTFRRPKKEQCWVNVTTSCKHEIELHSFIPLPHCPRG